ncbi:uncharacterized protein PADG_04656 [Paracoccidioides brasiliensis Pb18]|uniref:Nucleoporin NUP53 n=2 Tax=Paracoccidioides brasiliensis TaxID=121759 RepID=C1GCD4_PARBD|nr:uncharacterized protein PADG_04656 [Paracoccidioides brasiliensis Pb18]EEH48577.1 hypothetical protein PADG_04656 [Paracoccidioides brasiliensis Pb18]ODH44951.1 hypothetical protein ACO22_00574 [Paracoccidioides brasiliensis]
MEYHAVPLEERARDEKGNVLPWGYVYKDEARNPRRPPEESGPFGKRRNARYNSTRSGTRTGTPARKENPNVAEFGKLFAQQQEQEQNLSKHLPASTSNSTDSPRKSIEKVATECILYGYKNKESEWKVIDKFERISQGMICEDYPRTDPELAPKYPRLLSGGDVVIHPNLSSDANKKAKRYAGGFHWIKVTFDSAAAADRACFFSPQEIDGFMIFCEPYHGHGPQHDAPIPKDSTELVGPQLKSHTLNSSQSNIFFQSADVDRTNLPRPFSSPTIPNNGIVDDSVTSQRSSTTTSSATAIDPAASNTLRQRQTQTQSKPRSEPKPESEFMTHIPTVRRAVLRPISEALPPQPTVVERVLRSIPILSWFTGDIVGDGPVLREDGSFDHDKSGAYWRFWYMVDKLLGTDLCGLKEES